MKHNTVCDKYIHTLTLRNVQLKPIILKYSLASDAIHLVTEYLPKIDEYYN